MCPITAVNFLVTGQKRSLSEVNKAIQDLNLDYIFGDQIVAAADDYSEYAGYRDKMLRILKLEK